jgi:hypothetical protein
MRVPVVSAVASIILLTMSGTAAAQGAFGIGGRIAFIRSDVDIEDEESRRFWGGQIRARMSPRTAVELSFDLRTETNEAETLRIRSNPIQASLLLFPARGAFSPFVLGGAGWYAQRFETLAGDETVLSETVREFGWHAGFGAELRMGAHAGLHADYRYTFLDFGGDDDDDDDDDGPPIVGRFLPGYRGSMWTAGLTFYF